MATARPNSSKTRTDQTDPSAAGAPKTHAPRIGLAMSGGGARGLGHIPVLEAFDSAGCRPARIAGTSMGALVGALYASGMSGADLRAFTLDTFGNPASVMSRLWATRRQRGRVFQMGWGRPTQFDAHGLLEAFLPPHLPPRIEDLDIPLSIVAVDFNAAEERVITSGPLVQALAASIAVPAVIKPVLFDGAVHIDGGAANPLPHDAATHGTDLVVASDVVLMPNTPEGTIPTRMESVIGATQILMQSVARAKAALNPPALLVRPDVSGFSPLDFLKPKGLIAAGEAAGAEVAQWLHDHAGVDQRTARA
jgi:NTE family protein